MASATGRGYLIGLVHVAVFYTNTFVSYQVVAATSHQGTPYCGTGFHKLLFMIATWAVHNNSSLILPFRSLPDRGANIVMCGTV